MIRFAISYRCLVRFAALSETFKVSIDLQVLRTFLITYAPVNARQAATLLRVCRKGSEHCMCDTVSTRIVSKNWMQKRQSYHVHKHVLSAALLLPVLGTAD
jgi:hypothetical protein